MSFCTSVPFFTCGCNYVSIIKCTSESKLCSCLANIQSVLDYVSLSGLENKLMYSSGMNTQVHLHIEIYT
jgi:hypothetical protein